MATVKFCLDKRREKKDGTYPIKLNVFHNRQMIISTQFSAAENEWDGNEFSKGSQNYKPRNIAVRSLMNKAETVIFNLEQEGKLNSTTDSALKTMIERAISTKVDKDNKNFIYYLDEFVSKKSNIGTRTVYSTTRNKILACKPAVSQNIPEFHSFTYGSFYHVNHKTDFACRIFVDSFLQGILFVTGLGETVFEFLGGHTKISFSPFFTKKCKIENHLGCSVCYDQKQCLESQNASVLNMGMHPADIFEAASGFGIVRIINYQTGGVFLMLGTDFDFRPKLHVKMIDKFTPINLRVAHKTVEHIFFAVQQAA